MSALIPHPNNQTPSTHVNANGVGAANGNGFQIPKISFREVINVILRWSWIPVVFAIIGAIALYSYVSSKPVFYTAYGNLEVKTRAPEIFSDNPLAEDDTKNLEQMKTVEQGLLSSTVLLRVVEKYDLASDPLYRANGVEQQALLETLIGRASVDLRKGTRLLDIVVKDTEPQRAKDIVEEIVNSYRIWKEEETNDLITRASKGLSSEEARLREKMGLSEQRLQEFRSENLVLGLDGEQERLNTSKLETLNQELSGTIAERLRLESVVQAMAAQGENGNNVTLAARGDKGQLFLTLRSEITRKEADFAILKKRYKFKHYKYIEAEQEIKRLQEDLAAIVKEAKSSLNEDLAITRVREQELQQMVNQAQTDAMNDEATREKFAQLKRNAEIDRALHSQVSTRLEKTQIGAALNSSFLRWNERPLRPAKPSGRDSRGFLLVGGFLGAMLGVFIALVFSLSDPRVRESTAVERKLGLPILANLPVFSRDVVQEMTVEGDVISATNRPAHLVPYAPVPGDKSELMQTLLFVSPFDGDGKTLCVLKCARTMVRQGYRTLVIDADFSQAGLSRDYDRQNEWRHGLAAYLMGEVEPAEVLFETGLAGLWFMPTGMTKNDTGEMLSGPQLRRLLEAITPMFDRVIFDISSVQESDDVQAVARFVNSTYLVARKGRGKYSDLKDTCQTISSAGGNVSGVIWNNGGIRRGPGSALVIEPITYPSEVREVSPRGQDEPMPAPPEIKAV